MAYRETDVKLINQGEKKTSKSSKSNHFIDKEFNSSNRVGKLFDTH